MNPRIFPLGALFFVMLFSSNPGGAQDPSSSVLVRTSAITWDGALDTGPALAPTEKLSVFHAAMPQKLRPFSMFGFDAHAGIGGIGFDVATPLARKFSLRVGSDFFGYSTTFKDQGANVTGNLRMRSGHGSLDWFPFRGRFRISPLVVFANNNRVQASALIPAGDTINLGGQDYISSLADPLHGGGSVDFRRVSPGLTLGLGNIIPRVGNHFSAPVEAGFYYVGQPGLKVNFSGSACYPGLPETIGCMPANQDPGFQQNLAAFIARNRNNLSYVSFYPIFSAGIGYAF
jgi:hypothetical protein